MSKPEKYGDAFDTEGRAEIAGTKDRGKESAEGELDDLESSEDLLEGRAGVSKEIKLGLAVILVLLVVLGVVVARRMMRPSSETASSEPEAAKAESKQAPAAKREAPFPSAAKAAAVSSFQGRSAPGERASADPWAMASDDGKDSRTDLRVRPGSSIMPKDSGPGSPNRAGGFDRGPGAATAAGSWQGDASPGGPSERRVADPFNDRRFSEGGTDGPSRATSAGAPPSRFAAAEAPRLQSPTVQSPSGQSLSGQLPVGQSAGSFGQSPFGQSSRSFGSSGGNILRENAGAAGVARGAGPPSRFDFGDRKIDDASRPAGSAGMTSPRELSPATRPWDSSPRAVGLTGSTGDPMGRSPTARTALAEPRRSDGTYEVQINDSFWTISNSLYGTGAYYEALLEHNRKKYSSAIQLKPGDVILAPSAEELARLYPNLCPKPAQREALAERAGARGPTSPPPGTRTYVVQEGDSIYDIARSELGSALRWNEVYQLNRDLLGKHPEYITPGMKLVLPQDSGSPGVLTRRPATGFMR